MFILEPDPHGWLLSLQRLEPDPHVWLLSLQRTAETIHSHIQNRPANESLSCLYSLCEYFIHKIQNTSQIGDINIVILEPSDIIVIAAITQERPSYVGEMYPLEDFEQGKESKEELLSLGFMYIDQWGYVKLHRQLEDLKSC